MISKIVKNNLIPSGDFIFGFADLRGLLSNKFDGFNFGISIGKRLENNIIDKLQDGPTMEYYHYYNRINRELSVLSKKIQFDLDQAGIGSIAIEPTIFLDAKENEMYLKSLVYDISHKMVATRAGLGWIGKTDLLISYAFGPRLRLTSILLRQNPGINSIPVDESKCGNCKICVLRCPANAANGKLWFKGTDRNEFFDAFKCREKCGELAKGKLKVNERICGLCVCVCPKYLKS